MQKSLVRICNGSVPHNTASYTHPPLTMVIYEVWVTGPMLAPLFFAEAAISSTLDRNVPSCWISWVDFRQLLSLNPGILHCISKLGKQHVCTIRCLPAAEGISLLLDRQTNRKNDGFWQTSEIFMRQSKGSHVTMLPELGLIMSLLLLHWGEFGVLITAVQLKLHDSSETDRHRELPF